MGEVWKARDTRLNRTVAVKVSQERFSDRFEREARAVAALNHPHICTLHDVGPNYLVMEFVEGTELKGPLPLAKVVEYVGQICDALDAAHRRGITHRDLKPGNLLITKQGIKLLDFGLAKSATDQTLTTTGAVMGTPAYMSPEQWGGQPGDARSDIYALGCVLYELLTGRRAAQDRSPLRPRALENLVARSLAADPEERWQSARDVKLALEIIAEGPEASSEKSGRQTLAWAVSAVLALVALVALWAPWRGPPPADPIAVGDVDIDLGATPTERNIGPDAILSPDGTRLVVVGEGTNGVSRLLTRHLDERQLVDLPGTEGAFAPFFKPDGQWIAFFIRGKLRKMHLDGGAPIDLCDAPSGRGGCWAGESIVAALDTQAGLSLVPEEWTAGATHHTQAGRE
jgi:serine/threonine-protein kinase